MSQKRFNKGRRDTTAKSTFELQKVFAMYFAIRRILKGAEKYEVKLDNHKKGSIRKRSRAESNRKRYKYKETRKVYQ